MAEVTAFRNNALPYPVYGVPWAVTFPMLDADGDLVTGATTPDAEVSLNGNTFADCTNESVEIATNSGVYYLLLTAAEMTADIVTVIAKSATAGMKTTVLTFYPRKLVSLRTGTSQGGAAGSITLDASAGAMDDIWNGCLCVAVIDTLTEARVISDYTGSTQVAAVIPNWNVTPDSDDTFTIYLPEGRQIWQSNLTGILGTITATPATAGILDVNVKNMNNVAGTPITTIKAVQGLTTADVVTTATNVTTVNGLANNVITAASMNADASAEIADAVWDEDATGHQTLGTFGQAIGDPVADTTTIYQSVVTDAAGTNVAADIIAMKADTAAILVDTGTTLDGRIPAALVGGRMDSSVGAMAAAVVTAAAIATDAIDADAIADNAIDAGAIAANAITAAKIADSALDALTFTATIGTGTCDALSTTTSVIASAVVPASAVNDQFNGRIIIFDRATTTAALRGQATDITDYVHATLTFTVTALTTAPVSGDTFHIL